MARNSKSARNKKRIQKANSNTNTTEQRSSKKAIGSPSIQFVKDMVSILKPYELSPARRLETFQLMMLDDSVSHAFQTNAVFVEKAFAKYTIEYDQNSEKSKEAKEFLDWNLRNLSGQSLRSIARSAAEMKRDGLAPFEKIFERAYDEWETTPQGNTAWKLKKLNYISPLSLYKSEPFVISGGGREITEMRQSVQALKNSGSNLSRYKNNTSGYLSIPMNKVVMMTYSSTDAQPFGVSPFEACYTAWREKVLLQELTTVGVSKDLSGTPVLHAPASILNEAAADPSSAAGISVEQLKQGMANLHAGDQAYMILPSDTFNDAGSGASEYKIEFLGVSGGKCILPPLIRNS